MTFWAIFIGAQCIGEINSYMLNDAHDTGLVVHDTIAFALMASICCLGLLGFDAAEHLQRVTLILSGAAGLSFLVQIGMAFGLIQIPGITPWYWDRFRGLAENPNQLAFFCSEMTALPIAAGALLTSRLSRFACFSVAGGALYVGLLTGSNVYKLFIAVGALSCVTLMLFRLQQAQSDQVRIFAASCLILFSLLWIAGGAFALAKRGDLGASVQALSRDNRGTQEEAALRVALWDAALERGLASGLLGYGPGPHLDIPESLIAARRATGQDDPAAEDHPKNIGIPNFESHSTLLEIYLQGGLLAATAFVSLLVLALTTAFKARFVTGVGLILGLAVISIFHVIFRNPLFWFCLTLVLSRMPYAASISGWGIARRPCSA